MREYLFRGKRVDNGEWVEGYYLVAAGMPFISVFAVREPISVFPETVGQYIAKHKIFTGDICEITDGEITYQGVITWDENCTSYVLTRNTVKCTGFVDKAVKTNTLHLDAFEDDCWQFEVIGNIHDKEENNG